MAKLTIGVVAQTEKAQAALNQTAESVEKVGQSVAATGGRADEAGRSVGSFARSHDEATKSAGGAVSASEELREAFRGVMALADREGGFKALSQGLASIDASFVNNARGLLASLNPAMGKTLETATRLLGVLGKGPGPLLAIAAAAFGIKQVVDYFREMAEEAARAERALRASAEERRRVRAEQEGRAPGLRKEIADKLVAAGVDPSQTAAVLKDIQELQQAGVGRDLGESAALARQLGLVESNQTREFLGGVLARGGERPEFTTDQLANRRLVNDILRSGRSVDADRILTNYLSVTGPGALRDALSDAEVSTPGSFATALSELARQRDLGPQSTELLRRVFQTPGGVRTGVDAVGRDELAGAGLTESSIREMAGELNRIRRDLESRFGREARPVAEPQVINYTVNVNTAYNFPEDEGRGFLNPIDMPGGSLGGGE